MSTVRQRVERRNKGITVERVGSRFYAFDAGGNVIATAHHEDMAWKTAWRMIRKGEL